jgi:serine/threonine protein kinase
VPVFDLVEANGHWFMTMELAARTLHDDLAQTERDGAPDWADRARDARAVGAGLGAIHRHDVTHGDLTPRNVLRMSDGRLAIADFGLARKAGEKTLPHGGTLSYLAPEVMLGVAPDRRSDVWQLGIVLHEILLGGRPRWRMTGAGPVAALPPAFAPPAEIGALLAVARNCLAWDPALRPASADGVLTT